jgi:long-chain fatty acid transport protein
MQRKRIAASSLILCVATLLHVSHTYGQGYGSDLQNVMAPASGGMAGVSTAQPQDVPSAIFGNPATLTQFEGTQFTIGGAWIEGYPTLSNDGSLNGGTPFDVTSRTAGFVAPEIGVTQNLNVCDRSVTFGLGLSSMSGLGAEYRGMAPGTILNNFSSEYLVLGVTAGLGVQVNDQLSVGAAMTLGTAFEQLGFVGPIVGSAMVNEYALRATVGADYALNDCNTLGAFWQSRMDFEFPDAIRFNGNYQNLQVDQPATFGLGWANRALMDGNLLIAFDVYFKDWQDAALWQDVLVNQWVFAVGAQYTRGCYKYRIGYSYNTDPINHNVGGNLDGNPIGQANVQLFQAASAPFVNQNRLTVGVGRTGFLVPNLDLDVFGGVMFNASENFGPDTSASLALYYLGLGLTWKFGDGSSRP